MGTKGSATEGALEGGGPAHGVRLYKRPSEMGGAKGSQDPEWGAARGPQRAPRSRGNRREARFGASRQADRPLFLCYKRMHCAINLKAPTQRSYGKHKSEKLDQDAEPRTARYSQRTRPESREAPRKALRRGVWGAGRRAPESPCAHVSSPTRAHTRPLQTLRPVCGHPNTHNPQAHPAAAVSARTLSNRHAGLQGRRGTQRATGNDRTADPVSPLGRGQRPVAARRLSSTAWAGGGSCPADQSAPTGARVCPRGGGCAVQKDGRVRANGRAAGRRHRGGVL